MSTSQPVPEVTSIPETAQEEAEASLAEIKVEQSDTDSDHDGSTADWRRGPRLRHSRTMTARVMELLLQCRREGLIEGRKLKDMGPVWERVASEATCQWPSRTFTPERIAYKYNNEKRRYKTWLAFRARPGVRYNGKTGLFDTDSEKTFEDFFAMCKHPRETNWLRKVPLGDPAVYHELFPPKPAAARKSQSGDSVLDLTSATDSNSNENPSSQTGSPRKRPVDLTGPAESGPTLSPRLRRSPRLADPPGENSGAYLSSQSGPSGGEQPIDLTSLDEGCDLPSGLPDGSYLGQSPSYSDVRSSTAVQGQEDRAHDPAHMPEQLQAKVQQRLNSLPHADRFSLVTFTSAHYSRETFVYTAARDLYQRFSHKLPKVCLKRCLERLGDPATAALWAAFDAEDDELKEMFIEGWLSEKQGRGSAHIPQ